MTKIEELKKAMDDANAAWEAAWDVLEANGTRLAALAAEDAYQAALKEAV